MIDNKMKEVDYYPEISEYFAKSFEANFSCTSCLSLQTYFVHTVSLQKGLQEIILANRLDIPKLKRFAEKAPPLFLDIFGVVTDGIDFEIIILEIKQKPSVGLTELSQLVGYSMVSKSSFGVLINVDGECSPYLKDILATNQNMTDFVAEYQGESRHHFLSVMEWNSITKNIRYTAYGQVATIGQLCERLIDLFEMNSAQRAVSNLLNK